MATANLLTDALLRRQDERIPFDDRLLAGVRARRRLPTAVAQTFQRVAQQSGIRRAQQHKLVLEGVNPFALARFGFVRRSVAHLIGVGVRPEHVQAR